MLNINAELLPGKAGAGIELGQLLSAIHDLAHANTISERINCRVLQYGSIWLFESNGVVNQVCVFAGYRGKVAGTIGITSTIADVEAFLGQVVDYEGVCFGVASMPGWCFEVEKGLSMTDAGWLNAQLKSICIYKEDAE